MIMLMANINDTWQDITAYTGAYSRADNIRALGAEQFKVKAHT